MRSLVAYACLAVSIGLCSTALILIIAANF